MAPRNRARSERAPGKNPEPSRRKPWLPIILGLGTLAAWLAIARAGPGPAPAPADSPPATSIIAREPEPPPLAREPREPSTTIVVLKVAPGGVTLVTSAEKPFRPEAPVDPGDGPRWRLEDPADGRVLATGPLELPRLCSCPEGRDHQRGCVVVPHEAVVRLHLPRVARRERLTLVDAGVPLASFSLEDPS